MCRQCFDAVGWAAWRASGLKKLSGVVLAWLSVWSEVQMICIWSSWCHYHPIISCSSRNQNGLPLWCSLTQLVLEKGRPLNKCSSSSSSSSSNIDNFERINWKILCFCSHCFWLQQVKDDIYGCWSISLNWCWLALLNASCTVFMLNCIYDMYVFVRYVKVDCVRVPRIATWGPYWG